MIESLQQKNRIQKIVGSGKKELNSHQETAAALPEKKLQIRDAISWSICFGIVALLTGALLFYNIGVTISTVTSLLFYGSLAGFLFFTGKAILLLRTRETPGLLKSRQVAQGIARTFLSPADKIK